MSSPGQGFARTLEAAQEGAEWAWAEIYRELAPAVLGYLRARGATEPEDLTGEVFVRPCATSSASAAAAASCAPGS